MDSAKAPRKERCKDVPIKATHRASRLVTLSPPMRAFERSHHVYMLQQDASNSSLQVASTHREIRQLRGRRHNINHLSSREKELSFMDHRQGALHQKSRSTHAS